MTILTEAKIRKLIKDSSIVENGVFKLSAADQLTPAARSFLNDRHISIKRDTCQTTKSSMAHPTSSETKETLPVSYWLVRLTKLYPSLLKSQQSLYVAFQQDKCLQLEKILKVIERLVGQQILTDMIDYDDSLLTISDLQAIRINKQLDQQAVMMTYDVPSWRLSCYESYIDLVLIRKEIEVLADKEDETIHQVVTLLKALEVLMWLLASE